MTRGSRALFAVVAALVLGCAGADDDSPAPADAPATLENPAPLAAAPGPVLPAPREPLPIPQPTAPAAPLVIGGRATRLDGSPLWGATVKFWRRDDRGELAEVLAHTETEENGSFEIASGDWLSQVNAVQCRWQRFGNVGYDVVIGVPVGAPIDAWLDSKAVPDWSAISIALDTGWMASGLVQSADPHFEVRRLQVRDEVMGRIESVAKTGTFVVRDIPWELETCRIDVLGWSGVLGSGEATRPDREHGAKETWIEILLPMR